MLSGDDKEVKHHVSVPEREGDYYMMTTNDVSLHFLQRRCSSVGRCIAEAVARWLTGY